MEPIKIVDIVLAGVLVIGAGVGLARGLIRQVLTLVGLVVSFLAAILLAGWLTAFITGITSMPYSPALVVSFLLLFTGGLLAFQTLTIGLQKLVKLMLLGWVDRLGGGLLGLIVAMLVSSVGISFFLELPVSAKARRAVEASPVSMFLRPVAPALFDMVFSHGRRGIDYESILKRGGSV